MSVGRLDLVFNYDVTFTNTGTAGAMGSAALLQGGVYLKDDLCWGNDGGGSFGPFDTGQHTVPALGSFQDSGVRTEVLTHQVRYDACSSSQDAIHTTTGQSQLFAGPVQAPIFQSQWYLQFFPDTVTMDVNSASYTADVSITTVYELPLVAAPNGCDPLVDNSTGAAGQLSAFGLGQAGGGGTVLYASDLPADVPGFFLMSATTTPAIASQFGVATLCLGAPQYRWLDSLGRSLNDGTYGIELSEDGLPTPAGLIAPGETWHFQWFHRDVDLATGQPSANSTSAVSVTFQ